MVIILIDGYNIKKVNNEEVLYIYLDFNSEFARIDKINNTKIKNNIKKYIKNNNINFKGTLVALVVGGVLIGTISLNKPKKNYIENISKSNIVAIINNEDIDLKKDNNIEEETLDKENHDARVEEKKESINTKKQEIEKVNQAEVKEEEVSDALEVNNEEYIDTNIYINLYRTNGTVIKLELEEYIIGVVGAEMPASFNIEALKAQAIISRTYAIKSINNNKRLTDNNSTQNYKSNEELMSMWGSSYNTYYERIKSAVLNTKGLYLTYNGSVIDAVYHSTSNGSTEDSRNVWGNSVPYLVSVSSPYDNTNKSFLTSIHFSYDEINSKISNDIDSNTEFIINRNESNRVSNIEINGINYSGVSFRTLLGLRSTDFTIEHDNDGVNITTKGYGHGVGLSQYGANGMANNGSNYKDILLHYYKGVSFNSL